MSGTRVVWSAITASVLVVGALNAPAFARQTQPGTRSSTTIAPGLTFTTIDSDNPPEHARVLMLDPSTPLTLDIATAGGRMGRFQKTSVVAAQHGALAGINGDFSVAPGRPLHPFYDDGVLMDSGLQNGASFALTQDESQAFLGKRRVRINGWIPGKGHAFALTGWNDQPPATGADVVGYTSYGGTAVKPPGHTCQVRLAKPGPMRWARARMGITQDYVVEAAGCTATPMRVTRGSVVLVAKAGGAGAAELRLMKRGTTVRLHSTFEWPDVLDSIGGMPLLVSGGANVAPTCFASFCQPNPRTGIGVTADGHILLVVVDGRENQSVGMTLRQFGAFMQSLGAEYALNLDGGGGSTMWVRGKGIVNDPSDATGERPVSNVVLVLPGPDHAEPLPQAPRLVGPFANVFGPTVSDRQAQSAAMADPGSIGGLLQAMVSGSL